MANHKVILVVDDDELVRDMISTVLLKEGHLVFTAADGREAVNLSQSYAGDIDLLLTDVQMPHMDGITAYKHIRAQRAGIKVLFVTGGPIESFPFPRGVPVLPKPFITMSALSTHVGALLNASPS